MNKYGFSDSKCKQAVYVKDDFLILEGKITIDTNTAQGTKVIKYPEGFNQNNTIVISKSTYDLDPYSSGSWRYGISYSRGNYNYDQIDVDLYDTEIWVSVGRPEGLTSKEEYNYKVVLLKYKD